LRPMASVGAPRSLDHSLKTKQTGTA
jgi:hypothetical protein